MTQGNHQELTLEGIFTDQKKKRKEKERNNMGKVSNNIALESKTFSKDGKGSWKNFMQTAVRITSLESSSPFINF